MTEKIMLKPARSFLMILMMIVLLTVGGLPVLSVSADTSEGFAGGEGTQQSPWEIKTPEQLDLVRDYQGSNYKDKYFKLMNDIDLEEYLDSGAGYEKWGTAGWLPIGTQESPFCAYFDGNGYTVQGIWTDRTTEINRYIGLFGFINEAEISNLKVSIPKGKSIRGASIVGGLVGYETDSIITNCHVNGEVDGKTFIGGLVGYQNGGAIDSCTTSGTVMSVVIGSDNTIGGLVAYTQMGAVIRNCSSSSYVQGASNIGGLVGNTNGSPETEITNSFATGEVKGKSYVGGFIGYNTSGLVEECYASGDVSGTSSVGGFAGSTGRSITNSYSTGSVSGNGNYIGGFVGQASGGNTIKNSYAIGQVISNSSTSGGFVGYMASYFSLQGCFFDTSTTNKTQGVGNNINAVGISGVSTAEMQAKSTFTGAAWEFIETWYQHKGVGYPQLRWQSGFEKGEGTLNDPFQITSAAELDAVRNYLGTDHKETYFKLINDIDLTDYLTTGGAGHRKWGSAGWEPIGDGDSDSNAFYGNFDGSGHVIKGLWIERSSLNYVALFANLREGTIENLGVEIAEGKSVTGDWRVAGLVGYQNKGLISNCYVSGIINGTNYVGGLVGNNNGSVKASYSEGKVSGKLYIGGLAGVNGSSGNILNSYSLAAVSGNGETGGLNGSNSGTISFCYFSGSVTGTGEKIGGLVGLNNSTNLSNCFYDSDVSGKNSGTGYGDGSGVIGKTTAELQTEDTFTGWELDSIWGIYDGYGFPYLKGFGNNILIEPVSPDSKEYDGNIPSVNLIYDVQGSYQGTNPLNGELKIEDLKADAGEYKISQGTVKGTGYQISYKNDVVYTITKADTSITLDGEFTNLTRDGHLEVKIQVNKCYNESDIITYKMGGIQDTAELKNGKAEVKIDLSLLSAADGYILAVSYEGDTNHNNSEHKVEDITVGKAMGENTYTFPSFTNAIAYHPNKTLADIQLTNGTGNGSFAWVDSTIKPMVDEKEYEVVFSPNDADDVDYSKESGYADTGGSVTITRKVKLEVTPVQSSVTVKAEPAGITYGEHVTITAKVQGVDASEYPEGKVDFLANGINIGSGFLSDGIVSVVPADLKAGTYTITAKYSGESNYSSSYGELNDFRVDRIIATTVVFPKAEPDEVIYDPSKTLTSIGLTGGNTDGTFSWQHADTIPTVDTSSYPVVFVPNDVDNIDYSGEEGWDENSKTIIRNVYVDITPAKTSVTVDADKKSIIYGESVLLTAKVDGVYDADAPDGTIQFLLNDKVYDKPVAVKPDGTASVELKNLEADTYIITAKYSGAANYAGAEGSYIGFVVGPVQAELKFPEFDTSIAYHPNQTLGDITLSNGKGNGSFAWQDDSIKPTVDVNMYKVVFAPDDVKNYDYSGEDGWDDETKKVVRSVELKVSPADSSVEVTADKKYIAYNESVTFTATVKGLFDTEHPTGKVEFFANEISIGSEFLNNGRASVTITDLKAGTYTITVKYKGENNYNGADNVLLDFKVNPAIASAVVFPTADTDKVSYDPSKTLESIGLTGGDSNGTFAWQNPDLVPTVDVGAYPVIFTPNDSGSIDYSGEEGWNEETKTITRNVVLNVTPANVIVAVTTDKESVFYGESVTFTATIRGVSDIEVPSGTVQFILNDKEYEVEVTINSEGTAELILTNLKAGTYTVTAKYSGAINYAGASGSYTDFQVGQKQAELSFPEFDESVVYHPAQTLSDIILSNGSGNGSFSWRDDSIKPTVDVSAYEVVFTPDDTENYDYSMEEGWNGEAKSITRFVELKVTPANSSLEVTADRDNIAYGESVIFTATVKGIGDEERPSGEVEFFSNGISLGRKSLSDGIASVTLSDLQAGTYSISVKYSGETNYNGSNGILQDFRVNPAVASAVTFPVAEPTQVSYDPSQTLAGIELSGGDTNGTFAWQHPDTVPTVDIGSYPVIFTPDDLENIDYSGEEGWNGETETITRNIALKVNKTDPSVNAPVGITGIYGDILSMVSLPENWSWDNSMEILGTPGSHDYPATYTPVDTINYNVVQKTISLDVGKRPIIITAKDITIAFGENVPQLEWSITGGTLINGDTITEGSLKTEANHMKLGEYPIIEDTAFVHDYYDITFISGEFTVIANEAMRTVMHAVSILGDSIKTREQADAVADATNRYNALNEDEREEITDLVEEKLEKAWQQSAGVNHVAEDISIDGLPWYVRVIVSNQKGNSSVWKETAGRLDGRDLLALYDISLVDTLGNRSHSLSAGKTVEVTITGVDIKDRENITVFHVAKDGKLDRITAKVSGDDISFTADSFSFYGVAAKSAESEKPEPPTGPEPKPGEEGNGQTGTGNPKDTDDKDGGENTKKPSESVKTGDGVQMWIWWLLLVGALGIMGAVWTKSKNRR